MDIITYKEFSTLRLENFVSTSQDIQTLDNFEFMDAIWSGHSIGFTEWLQLDTDAKTKSISLDLNNLSDTSIKNILSTIKLNVTKGMTKESIVSIFGRPNNVETFVADRVTYEYVIGSKEKYYLSWTIHNDNGLVYLTLMNHADTIKALQKNAST